MLKILMVIAFLGFNMSISSLLTKYIQFRHNENFRYGKNTDSVLSICFILITNSFSIIATTLFAQKLQQLGYMEIGVLLEGFKAASLYFLLLAVVAIIALELRLNFGTFKND